MNKKVMLLSAAAIGTFALTLTAVLSSNKIGFLAKATESPYAIANSEYEVALFEQYNGGIANGYTNDKPLTENNLLGGHVYGNSGGNRQVDFVTDSMTGVNETLKWKFTCGRVKNDTAGGFITFGIETYSTDGNILDATQYPEGTDEYAIAQLTIGSSTNLTECSAMIMDSYIDQLDDFSVFWRNNPYGTKFSICYQIYGGQWARLENKGNYTGTRGWDNYGYTTFNSGSWTTKDLYQQKVRLAFAITNAGTDHGNFRPSAIVINANKAAVRYLNALSYREGMCTKDAQYDLNLGQADNRHNQDLFHLATERATGEFLANYSLAGTETKETSALGLYNHLVGAIPELGDAK